MKIMLINPSAANIKNNIFLRAFVSPVHPIGLAYLGAVLLQNNFKVIIVDQFAEKISNEELIKLICEHAPELVGFSCLTPVASEVKELSYKLKKMAPQMKIVLGNIHPSIYPGEILKEGWSDFIVRGEGEYTLLELAKNLRAKQYNFSKIKGLSYIAKGLIEHNEDRPPITDLDELPYPALHLLKLNLYREFPFFNINKPYLHIAGSRGCPYKCLFCAQESKIYKPRYRKIKNIIDEIQHFYEKWNINYFIFIDPFFPFSIESGMEFCDKLIKRGINNKMGWGVETRADLVNEELLLKMKEAGCRGILYGIESGNQKILKNINKEISLEQSYKAISYTKKAGISCGGAFVLGFPGENHETCRETISFAKKLDPDIAKFGVAIPYPGTKFFDKYCEKKNMVFENPDLFNPWINWLNFSEELVYTPKDLTSQEIIILHKKAMLSFYLRPQIILRYLLKKMLKFKHMFLGAILLLKIISTLSNSYFKKMRKKT